MQSRMAMTTWVGERGVTLSGGQRQRIGLRGPLCVTRLLILENATSSVDMETDTSFTALAELMAGRTSLSLRTAAHPETC